ncbi:threonine aldolase family protein [Sphingomicrobium sediminis]|uniref:Beta-eliminating lyase-related protein n=1 Tax=Sphingomicrobium sediminis TaxID=2950949 RepID=A0A9X2ELP2_9SPHN|nr:beta-eliminating lyase-related protein [Sphingomicrobium sediminis]MCM8557779.1 beta-eliminating lyase-related protein [Sphingomicrobium sediminis]
MRFFSDNAAPACPAVMAALQDANQLDTAYDGDQWSARIDAAISDLFETEAVGIWVTTGTAANGLALSAMCPPWGSILCHRFAHIEQDEAGAPGFYAHGAKLTLLDGPGAKVASQAIDDAMAAIRKDVHQVQPACLSVTNATEYGLAYGRNEMAALGEAAKRHKLKFHVDGARFANAVVSTGCSPAELTWKAGVDALSFGFIKNGGMSAELLVLFDTALADTIRVMKKRAGHLQSKGRFAAAQILAMLENETWLDNARAANIAATVLAEACGERLVYPVEANELFVKMTPDEAAAIRAQGFDFYDWAAGEVRLVTSWDQDMGAVEKLAEAIRRL